ncbi:hypothetical protein Mp_1g24910 [Marchantia polymorpha subsp. ruderalis]|uniref:Uncharacterized protein n=2 Tax=Marchantia polymorpha TaxID=3197 RepID=A0AAF6AU09_MARPO|nr:hypothetical protein MARPO_0061s0034 [Marchantia polymorpha]PTQ36758.1 hypothetical protein MARPO_0061s0034 [Marchantia polymorpha]BBM99928.1 hypothetical protein Mp_1g24910 [Marchantia polymorpha subsp. ruderalis]BBM99929.1 hypothetical protein Mp_1g24910 [Marchantia polymorpha subsp. ruderalis]|eukprot:PTQ36757.1 hypothetical protein MARPO_0061s0034 [Marchantia polymorpha]
MLMTPDDSLHIESSDQFTPRPGVSPLRFLRDPGSPSKPAGTFRKASKLSPALPRRPFRIRQSGLAAAAPTFSLQADLQIPGGLTTKRFQFDGLHVRLVGWRHHPEPRYLQPRNRRSPVTAPGYAVGGSLASPIQCTWPFNAREISTISCCLAG